jgi:hypothetical protein
VKFGPTVAVFRGEASLAFDDAARTCTIEGRGIDGRGASRALASGVVKASGGEVTELAVDGSFTVSGPLETFANAGGVHVARALLAEFSANLATFTEQRTAARRDAARTFRAGGPQLRHHHRPGNTTPHPPPARAQRPEPAVAGVPVMAARSRRQGERPR